MFNETINLPAITKIEAAAEVLSIQTIPPKWSGWRSNSRSNSTKCEIHISQLKCCSCRVPKQKMSGMLSGPQSCQAYFWANADLLYAVSDLLPSKMTEHQRQKHSRHVCCQHGWITENTHKAHTKSHAIWWCSHVWSCNTSNICWHSYWWVPTEALMGLCIGPTCVCFVGPYLTIVCIKQSIPT